MGRAIVRQPKAFLMDELLSNLDAKLRVQMRADIKKLQGDLGVTTIYVTHDQVEAMTMGDRVAVMRKGKLQQVAPPEELYERPVNVFVAGFIGSPAMNMLQGRIELDAVAVGDARVPVSGLASQEGREVIVGIRPEDLGEEPAELRLRGRVELREALGAEVLLHVSVDARPALTDELRELAADVGEDRLPRATLVARVGPRTSARQGDTIDLFADGRALHFFDAETGAALQRRP
jgi:multiple sugar transport system ATP-binding protein